MGLAHNRSPRMPLTPMSPISRRSALATLAVLLSGCSTRRFEPLTPPADVPLQDPLPGQAIAYLMRAPHDPGEVTVYLGDRQVAVLPAETYTAVSVAPGSYVLKGVVTGQEQASAGGLAVSFQAGERRFFYTAVPSDSHVAFTPLLGAATFLPMSSPVGPRAWQECREVDAQGLMSIGRLVLPAN